MKWTMFQRYPPSRKTLYGRKKTLTPNPWKPPLYTSWCSPCARSLGCDACSASDSCISSVGNRWKSTLVLRAMDTSVVRDIVECQRMLCEQYTSQWEQGRRYVFGKILRVHYGVLFVEQCSIATRFLLAVHSKVDISPWYNWKQLVAWKTLLA